MNATWALPTVAAAVLVGLATFTIWPLLAARKLRRTGQRANAVVDRCTATPLRAVIRSSADLTPIGPLGATHRLYRIDATVRLHGILQPGRAWQWLPVDTADQLYRGREVTVLYNPAHPRRMVVETHQWPGLWPGGVGFPS